MPTYTVELPRNAEFPLDMLRYDSAAGLTDADDSLIAVMSDLERDRSDLERRVRITLTSPSRHAPHTKRWESFGVLVVESDNPFATLSDLTPTPAPVAGSSRLAFLSISKRDDDAYDVTDGLRRLAAIRGVVERDGSIRAGSWRVRWEGPGPAPVEGPFMNAKLAIQALFDKVLA